ncbi:ANKRD11 [Symbiodinium sp. CCMP2592]|nr:ANKRD11 [Symbiodinium sp. CCMP2592]
MAQRCTWRRFISSGLRTGSNTHRRAVLAARVVLRGVARPCSISSFREEQIHLRKGCAEKESVLLSDSELAGFRSTTSDPVATLALALHLAAARGFVRSGLGKSFSGLGPWARDWNPEAFAGHMDLLLRYRADVHVILSWKRATARNMAGLAWQAYSRIKQVKNYCALHEAFQP